MKKKSILKVSLITIGIIILIPCLFIGGVLGYRWTQDYIFYPRTIQDVIDKYDNMDEEKAFERGYCDYERYGGKGFSYSKPVYKRYKGRAIAKNRIIVEFKEDVDEDVMNRLAKKYKAEIVLYFGADFFGIELKQNYTLNELEVVIKEIGNDSNVIEAKPFFQ